MTQKKTYKTNNKKILETPAWGRQKGQLQENMASIKLEQIAKREETTEMRTKNEKWTQGSLKCKWKSRGSKEQNWHCGNNIRAVKDKHETLYQKQFQKTYKNKDRKGDI